MSATNGHLPEGATIATLEMLRKANTTYRKLPKASEEMGAEIGVWIRKIRAVVYDGLLAAPPPESKDWPEKGPERMAAYLAWYAALPDEQKDERRAQANEVAIKVIAAGVVNPPTTVETAHEFGADIDYLSQEILIFSGLLEPDKPAESPQETSAA